METSKISYFFAVDPGVLGAYCVLDQGGMICDMKSMPSMESLQGIAEMWRAQGTMFCIEDVTPNFKWRMKSTWTFAQHVGQLHLIFPEAVKVYPRTWQAAMWQKGLIVGDAKSKSLRSVKHYVDEKVFIGVRKKVPHDGMIDAYLIAQYCRTHRQLLEASRGKK